MKTKKWFFEWIWQYVNDEWIGWNPIGIEFEYDKRDPSLTFKIVVLGVGFEVLWMVPWDTQYSLYVKACNEALKEYFMREDGWTVQDTDTTK